MYMHTPEQFELVSHCQTCLQTAVSVLEYDLVTPLIYSRVGKKNARDCLYFFEPIITVLGGANPGCSDGAPCKTDSWESGRGGTCTEFQALSKHCWARLSLSRSSATSVLNVLIDFMQHPVSDTHPHQHKHNMWLEEENPLRFWFVNWLGKIGTYCNTYNAMDVVWINQILVYVLFGHLVFTRIICA